jgi:hypothetical protein
MANYPGKPDDASLSIRSMAARICFEPTRPNAWARSPSVLAENASDFVVFARALALPLSAGCRTCWITQPA